MPRLLTAAALLAAIAPAAAQVAVPEPCAALARLRGLPPVLTDEQLRRAELELSRPENDSIPGIRECREAAHAVRMARRRGR